MIDYALLVTRVQNGFLITYKDEEAGLQMEVFEDRNDDNFSHLYNMSDVLNYIINHFGMMGTKHDAKRLMAEVVDQ